MPNRKDKWKGKTFKVTIKLPEHVPENIRRDKINRLYDILKPKNDKDCDEENGGDEDDKKSTETA